MTVYLDTAFAVNGSVNYLLLLSAAYLAGAPLRRVEFCHGLRRQLAVLCDGTVVPCCLDGEGELALGNLFRQELEDILRGERAAAIHAGFDARRPVEELCRRCGYAERFTRG